mgnify:CR=1 FL=1
MNYSLIFSKAGLSDILGPATPQSRLRARRGSLDDLLQRQKLGSEKQKDTMPSLQEEEEAELIGLDADQLASM